MKNIRRRCTTHFPNRCGARRFYSKCEERREGGGERGRRGEREEGREGGGERGEGRGERGEGRGEEEIEGVEYIPKKENEMVTLTLEVVFVEAQR